MCMCACIVGLGPWKCQKEAFVYLRLWLPLPRERIVKIQVEGKGR